MTKHLTTSNTLPTLHRSASVEAYVSNQGKNDQPMLDAEPCRFEDDNAAQTTSAGTHLTLVSDTGTNGSYEQSGKASGPELSHWSFRPRGCSDFDRRASARATYGYACATAVTGGPSRQVSKVA